jgi:hypothetical protein
MQAGSGGGNGSSLTGVNGLVALSVSRAVRAAYIRREGNVPQVFNQAHEVGNGSKSDSPFAKTAARYHLGL